MMRAALSALLAFGVVLATAGTGSMQSPSRVPADIAAQAADGPVRVIVKLNVSAVPEARLGDARAVASQRAAIAAAQDAVLLQLPGLTESVRRFESFPAFAVTTDRAGLERLAELPSVAGMALDILLKPALGQSASIVRADVLWGQGTEGVGWNVALLDSGVERSHSFLGGRVTAEACFSTNVADPTDPVFSLCRGGNPTAFGPNAGLNCTGLALCDHGTQVAGVAAGRGSSFSGIARGAGIISIKVYSRFTSAASCGSATPPCIAAFLSDIISGLLHVQTLAGPTNAGRVAAVNLSLRGATRYPNFCDATNEGFVAFTDVVNQLRGLGIATVVSSGNESDDSNLPFPACISRVISVGSVSKRDVITSTTNRSRLLDLYAPGEGIQTSTVNDGFASVGGTSAAAPHVTGAWALLKNRVPDASVDLVLEALQKTGVPIFETSNIEEIPRIVIDRAAGSLGPAGSPTAVQVTVSANSVFVQWENPFDGTPVSGFHVEILNPAGVPAAVVNVGTARTLTTTLAPGAYRIRVRTITAAGPGQASSEIPFFVGTPPVVSVPLPPRDLRAVVDGLNVSLTWNLPVESPPATSYLIDVGTLPGLLNIGTLETGSPSTTRTVTATTPGIYYVRLRARNPFGISGSSNEVTVTITGGGGCGLPPSGLNATVIGSLVTLNWSPPPLSADVTGYLVEVGSAPGQSNIARITTGISTVVSGTAGPGIYFVRVRALTTCGTTGPTNEVTVVVP